jgi:hypothetical protein
MAENWIDWVGVLFLAGLVQAAVVLFLRIQVYLNDPQRASLNERWFAQFEQNIQKRYSDGAMRWRVEGLSKHFHRDHRHH